MLPCIKESCLGIFSATADQRFMIGEDIFLRTHYPITMRRFRPGGEVAAWSEEDLLRELASSRGEAPSGNRTFVLYGAAGSGKSEMIRWLECNLGRIGRRPYALRISRTELDPLKILQKILSHFQGISLDEAIYHHWEDLRKKPVTLANHLVWSALGKMLPSDEEIIPISYRLRPIIEKNLRLNFSGIDSPSEMECRTPELISLEDLEELARQCSLGAEIDSGQLRYLMGQELEKAVLGGYNFVETLRAISQELMARESARPLLLIDDLVQSMNIYSTDLLDFFITMEEGNWDIVLGLTPASFEANRRGREILSRITTLDTFDDRLIKLWLTDEQGHDSYFINIDNCHQFAERYLMEFKRLGGFSCGGGCILIEGCAALQAGMSILPNLSPFNQALLARIYRSLPRGKGKARYFIAAIGEILRGAARGDMPGTMESYIAREISVNHPDPAIRFFAEAYAPESARKRGTVAIRGRALALLLGRQEGECGDLEVELSDLSAKGFAIAKVAEAGEIHLDIDASKAAVRDWLEGRPANKELLKGLRLGISFLCREIAQPSNIIPPNTSRLSPQIRWDETVEGSKLPVSLEGLDTFEGIRTPRALGHAAYSLNYLHLKRGKSKEDALAASLRSEETYGLFYAAQELRVHLRLRLEGELGLPLDDFAYLLFLLLLEFGQGGDEVPVALREEYPRAESAYPGVLAPALLPEGLAEGVRALFKDWLLLRENIYDAIRLTKLRKKYANVDPILEIAKIKPIKISTQYKVGDLDLSTFMRKIQQSVNELVGTIRGEGAQKERQKLEEVMKILGEMQHPGTHTEIQGLLSSTASSLGLPQLHIPDWQACQKLYSHIRRKLRPYLGKDGRVSTDTPISAHRFLLVLGEIDCDPVYAAVKELCSFAERGFGLIQRAPEDLHQAAERAGVAGHLALCKDWGRGEGDEYDASQGMEGLVQLTRSAKDLARRRKYLKLLEIASPYIDYKLSEDAQIISEVLQNILALGLPPHFTEKIQLAQGVCRDYVRALDGLHQWNDAAGVWDRALALLRDAHQKLYDGRLRLLLLGIGQEWQSYLENLGLLAGCLGLSGRDLPGLAERGACELREISAEIGSADIAKALYCTGGYLLEVPLPREIEDQVSGSAEGCYSWLLDMLLSPSPPEAIISKVPLDKLQEFCTNYPALAQAINMKLYLSHKK